MARSFFRIENADGNEVFLGNDPARGPWDPDSCHAGPPAALLARACEQAIRDHDRSGDPVPPDKRELVRLTVDLARPIPMDGFRVEAVIRRVGRATASTEAALVDLDDRICATAWSLHLSTSPPTDLPSPTVTTPLLSEAVEGGFPIERTRHGLPAFNTGVEARYPPGQDRRPGPTTMWMRTIQVLDSEDPTPFQRICALADSGNAIGRNAEPHEVAFLNADLTITLHRQPRGQWLGSTVVSHWQRTGIGMADAMLFDDHGPVGRAVQTLLLRKVA